MKKFDKKNSDKAIAGKTFKTNLISRDYERMISNYVTMTPSNPPNMHKFREENRTKWISKRFIP